MTNNTRIRQIGLCFRKTGCTLLLCFMCQGVIVVNWLFRTFISNSKCCVY